MRARIDKAISCSPCMMLLRNIEALARKSQALETGQGECRAGPYEIGLTRFSPEPAMTTVLRDCFAVARSGWKTTGFPVIILATTCDVEKVPTGVLGAFKEESSIEAPGEAERHNILKSLTSSLAIAPDVSLRALAVQTAALVANDLVDLVRRARSAAATRVLQSLGESSKTDLIDLQHAGVALTAIDFNEALEKARSSYSESIGAPKIPSVTWDDVGGLANVKTDILDTIQLPLEHPELFADGLKKRSGKTNVHFSRSRMLSRDSLQVFCCMDRQEPERPCSPKLWQPHVRSISFPSKDPSCSTCTLESRKRMFDGSSSVLAMPSPASSSSTNSIPLRRSEAIRAIRAESWIVLSVSCWLNWTVWRRAREAATSSSLAPRIDRICWILRCFDLVGT